MARAQKPKPGTAMVNWDEELAKQAQIAAGMESNMGGGQFFGLKSGILTWNDAPMPHNKMAVVIVDHVLENVFFEGQFDPDVVVPPTCFAFGRDEKTMRPHEAVVEAKQQMCGMSGLCQGCEMNEYGTAQTGRGKACRNTRRLAMIPAGLTTKQGEIELFEDVDHYKSAELGFMKLPVTSTRGYATYVKQLATALKRPPHGVITLVKVIPDPQSQFRVTFELLEPLANELIGVAMERNAATKELIEFPYSLEMREQKPKGKPARGAAAKPAAKAKGRKY